jgi:hypothetical protein
MGILKIKSQVYLTRLEYKLHFAFFASDSKAENKVEPEEFCFELITSATVNASLDGCCKLKFVL